MPENEEYVDYEMKSIMRVFEAEDAEFSPMKITRQRAVCADVAPEKEPSRVEGGEVFFTGECRVIVTNGQRTQQVPIVCRIEDEVETWDEAFDKLRAQAVEQVQEIREQIKRQKTAMLRQAREQNIRRSIEGKGKKSGQILSPDKM